MELIKDLSKDFSKENAYNAVQQLGLFDVEANRGEILGRPALSSDHHFEVCHDICYNTEGNFCRELISRTICFDIENAVIIFNAIAMSLNNKK
jgi:hypothetical protein